jgi:ADP-heptose:LPS heptosyltransferase
VYYMYKDKISSALGGPPKTIAVFRAIKIGDLLCAVPAFRALRKAFPKAHIALISLPWAKEFVSRFSEYFDEFIHFPGYPGLPEQAINPPEIVNFLKAIQQRQFDLVLQMQGNGTIVNSMVSLFGARITAGYYPAGHIEQYCPDQRFYIPYPEGEHEVKRHVHLMEFLGIASHGYVLEFPLTPVDEQQAMQLPEWPQLAIPPYVCIHPGGISARRWPATQFAEVADALASNGFTIVLTGTLPEKEVVEEMQQYMQYPAISLAGRTDLGTLAWIVQQAALLVSNDTGVSHIAAALQVPSVVIYTTSKPSEWGPLNRHLHHVILEEEATHAQRVIEEALEVLKENALLNKKI